MKYIIVSLTVLFCSTWALAVKAPGKVFYKNSDGNLVKREMTLVAEKTKDGKMQVAIATAKGMHAADRVFTRKAAGRSVVYLLFKKPEFNNKGEKGALILKGSLLKGNNGAAYYGDMFHVSYKKENEEKFSNEFQDGKVCQKCTKCTKCKKRRFRYAGGFGFHVKKEQKEPKPEPKP